MSVALCCGWAWEMQCRGRAAACRWVGARGRHGGLRGLEFQELGDGSRRIRHPTAEIETGKTSGAASCDVGHNPSPVVSEKSKISPPAGLEF